MVQSQDILSRLEQIRNIPTLPVILHKLGAAVQDPNVDSAYIAKIIEDDPSMMARILKVVNSVLYGTQSTIHSLKMVVSRLGFTAVYNVALSTAVFSTFPKNGQNDFNREDFWRHCIYTGIVANILCETCRESLSRRYDKDLLHLCGLLHDIGKIIFELSFHEKFLEAIQLSEEKEIFLYQAEQQVIGVDHTHVGEWLGSRWKLAPEVIKVIRWHHAPEKAEEEFRELVCLTNAADHICNVALFDTQEDLSAASFHPVVREQLGLEDAALPGVMEQAHEQSAHSEVLMSFV